jgi:prophage antirepressor-like protein
MEKDNTLIPFEGKNIRRIWHNEQWYISVVDVIEVLTDSEKPSQYWHNMKKRDVQLSPICLKLKLKGQDGKTYPSDCANTEGVLRIIMSVPSPKAEPMKLWLAQVGKQAIDEAENPELMSERQAELYRAKGYPEEWIGHRIQTIDTRNRLTKEWKSRGVQEGQEFGILTATIAKGTFGLTPSEHSELKGLKRQNLRDHMTPMELILTALGEEITRDNAVESDAQGFTENRESAVKGGQLAGRARKMIEEEQGKNVVSPKNFLELEQKDKPKELFENKEDM